MAEPACFRVAAAIRAAFGETQSLTFGRNAIAQTCQGLAGKWNGGVQ